MAPGVFDRLVRLPLVKHYEAAFFKATGVSLKVVPPDGQMLGAGDERRDFCRLVISTPAGCAECQQNRTSILRSAARKLLPQQIHCHAGLTVVATPVRIAGRHIATLLSGQVLRREPTERDFSMVVGMLGARGDADWVKKARKAYFETPVITADRFQAALELLNVFAQQLAEAAERLALADYDAEPKPVATAKQFVQEHVEEPISLRQVVEHVHVSRFYFCKLFKRATGMTLTEYVSRVRVEKAKALLADPSRRVSEVVFEAGFGSVPQFNSVFRRYVGMAPTEYRATVRE